MGSSVIETSRASVAGQNLNDAGSAFDRSGIAGGSRELEKVLETA